ADLLAEAGDGAGEVLDGTEDDFVLGDSLVRVLGPGESGSEGQRGQRRGGMQLHRGLLLEPKWHRFCLGVAGVKLAFPLRSFRGRVRSQAAHRTEGQEKGRPEAALAGAGCAASLRTTPRQLLQVV